MRYSLKHIQFMDGKHESIEHILLPSLRLAAAYSDGLCVDDSHKICRTHVTAHYALNERNEESYLLALSNKRAVYISRINDKATT